MNFVVAIAGHVFAEFFEVTAFAQLALRVHAEGTAIQEQCGEIFAFREQVGIDAKFRTHRH